MISTIKNRKIRSCDECTFSNNEIWCCQLFSSDLNSNCEYNFTQKEMQELIEQHNKTEKLFKGD